MYLSLPYRIHNITHYSQLSYFLSKHSWTNHGCGLSMARARKYGPSFCSDTDTVMLNWWLSLGCGTPLRRNLGFQLHVAHTETHCSHDPHICITRPFFSGECFSSNDTAGDWQSSPLVWVHLAIAAMVILIPHPNANNFLFVHTT